MTPYTSTAAPDNDYNLLPNTGAGLTQNYNDHIQTSASYGTFASEKPPGESSSRRFRQGLRSSPLNTRLDSNSSTQLQPHDVSSLSFFARPALRQHQNGAGFQNAIRDEDNNLARVSVSDVSTPKSLSVSLPGWSPSPFAAEQEQASFGQPFYNQPPFPPAIFHNNSVAASQATTRQTRHNLVAAPHFGPTGSSGLSSTRTRTKIRPGSRVPSGSQRPLLPRPFPAARPSATASTRAATGSFRHYVPSTQKPKQAFAPIRRTSGGRPSHSVSQPNTSGFGLPQRNAQGDVPFAGLADPIWDLSDPGNSGDIGWRSNPPAPSQSQAAHNQIDASKVATGSWGGGGGGGRSNISATTSGFPETFQFSSSTPSAYAADFIANARQSFAGNSTLPSSSPSNSRPLPSNANPSQYQHGPLTIKIPSATQRGVDLLEHAVEEKGQLDADDVVSSALDLSKSSRHLYSSAAAHSYSHHHHPTIIIPPAVQLGEEPRQTARKKKGKKNGPSTDPNSGKFSENRVIPPLSFRFFLPKIESDHPGSANSNSHPAPVLLPAVGAGSSSQRKSDSKARAPNPRIAPRPPPVLPRYELGLPTPTNSEVDDLVQPTPIADPRLPQPQVLPPPRHDPLPHPTRQPKRKRSSMKNKGVNEVENGDGPVFKKARAGNSESLLSSLDESMPALEAVQDDPTANGEVARQMQATAMTTTVSDEDSNTEQRFDPALVSPHSAPAAAASYQSLLTSLFMPLQTIPDYSDSTASASYQSPPPLTSMFGSPRRELVTDMVLEFDDVCRPGLGIGNLIEQRQQLLDFLSSNDDPDWNPVWVGGNKIFDPEP